MAGKNKPFRMEQNDFQECMQSLAVMETHKIITYNQWNKIRSKLVRYYFEEGFEYAT